jgi:PEP-CTERM motif
MSVTGGKRYDTQCDISFKSAPAIAVATVASPQKGGGRDEPANPLPSLNKELESMTISIRAAALMFAMAATSAQAAVTQYSGVDDGEIAGGGSANSSTAQASFLPAAASYGPVLTNYFDTVPLGYNTSFAISGATVTLAAGNFGPGFSGVTDIQVNGPSQGVFGYSTIESNTDNARWLGFPAGSATFTLSMASNSFGFFMTGLQTFFGNTLTVSFDGLDGQTFNLPVNTNGGISYFGFTADNPFTSVTIDRPGNDAWGIDGVTFNGVAAVPEPASWALLLLGFGLTGAMLRRRAAVSIA